MTCAASVTARTVPTHGAGPGSTPRAALQVFRCFEPRELMVRPVGHNVAHQVCRDFHYLKSYLGGSMLNFGVFAGRALVGVVVFGVGPFNIHRLFLGAKRQNVLCLTRMWLDDRCGRNSESRVLAIICRSLRRWQTTGKAIVAYIDPDAGHDGSIYRAAGFTYLGMSEPTPLYRLPDGSIHHSRSLGQAFGTHSLEYFQRRGFKVEAVTQAQKHVYITYNDPKWRSYLRVPPQPYPKKGGPHAID